MKQKVRKNLLKRRHIREFYAEVQQQLELANEKTTESNKRRDQLKHLSDLPQKAIDIQILGDRNYVKEHANNVEQLFAQNGYNLLSKTKLDFSHRLNPNEFRIHLSFINDQN